MTTRKKKELPAEDDKKAAAELKIEEQLQDAREQILNVFKANSQPQDPPASADQGES